MHIDNMIKANSMTAEDFIYPGSNNDLLFAKDYDHEDGEPDCKGCKAESLLQ